MTLPVDSYAGISASRKGRIHRDPFQIGGSYSPGGSGDGSQSSKGTWCQTCKAYRKGHEQMLKCLAFGHALNLPIRYRPSRPGPRSKRKRKS
jgi:hypothetical protein